MTDNPVTDNAAALTDNDWMITAIDGIDAAGREVWAAMTEALDLLAVARRERLDGVPATEVIDHLFDRHGREKRLQVGAAFAQWEHVVMQFRAEIVRVLVEEEGLTLTAAAHRMEVSRQMAARLYQAAARMPATS